MPSQGGASFGSPRVEEGYKGSDGERGHIFLCLAVSPLQPD